MNDDHNNKKKKLTEDPERLFDEKEFNTIKIGAGNEADKKTDPIRETLDLLLSKTPGDKDEALRTLKKENAAEFLLDAIKNSGNKKDKATLIAACWESGVDCVPHLEFFAALSADDDLFVSLEAITVISENVPGLEKANAQRIIDKLEPIMNDHFNADLIAELVDRLKQLD